MKVYVVTTLSSGEIRLSFDSQSVFANYEDAVTELRKQYQSLQSYEDYGEFTQNEYDVTYYSIILEEDDCDTIYEGYIEEREVE